MRTFRGTRAQEQRSTFLPPTTEDEFSTPSVDWYAVERAIGGEHPQPELTDAEKRQAALWLRQHGVPRIAVSVRLSVYERLVKEWEAEAGLLGPEDLCSHDDCNRASAGRGLCAPHLANFRVQERHRRAAISELAEAA